MTTWQSQTTQPRGTRPNVATPLSPPLAGTIKIATGGTSLTYGYGGFNDSYRLNLYNLLTQRGGLSINMIGCYSNGTSPANATHSTVASNTTQMLAGQVYDYAQPARLLGTTWIPDVMIVEHGTNNATDALAPTFRADYVAMCEYIQSLCPSVRLVLLTIPTGGDANRRGHIVTLNGLWDDIQADLASASIPHVLASGQVLTHGADQLPAEAPSWLHWGPSGQLKIADALFPAVMNACGYDAVW